MTLGHVQTVSVDLIEVNWKFSLIKIVNDSASKTPWPLVYCLHLVAHLPSMILKVMGVQKQWAWKYKIGVWVHSREITSLANIQCIESESRA